MRCVILNNLFWFEKVSSKLQTPMLLDSPSFAPLSHDSSYIASLSYRSYGNRLPSFRFICRKLHKFFSLKTNSIKSSLALTLKSNLQLTRHHFLRGFGFPKLSTLTAVVNLFNRGYIVLGGRQPQSGSHSISLSDSLRWL